MKSLSDIYEVDKDTTLFLILLRYPNNERKSNILKGFWRPIPLHQEVGNVGWQLSNNPQYYPHWEHA